jgi:hypothetical protein
VIPRAKPLSATQQALALRQHFPSATLRVKAGRLEWVGSLQPTPLSRHYSVRVSYQQGRVPEVRVVDALETRDEKRLPHTYANGSLCLYEPGQWHGQMWLATSTIPWTSEWLVHYEVWLATDDWYGGGVWPPNQHSPGKERAK